MGDFFKGCQNLTLMPNGKSVVNWGPYSLEVDHLLMSKEISGLFCNDVLRNEGDGKKPADFGPDGQNWIVDGASAGESRSPAHYSAALTAFRKWRRVNGVTHGGISAKLPAELLEDAAQYPQVSELWNDLRDRFSGQTLMSVPILHTPLFGTFPERQ